MVGAEVIPTTLSKKKNVDPSERRLRELGYKQELKRDLSFFTNFAFSFNVLSLLTGVTTLYNIGLTNGGPVVLIWGWIMVTLFTLNIGLVLGEICSAYPTSGGVYFWSAALSGPKWGPFASWMTGWFNAVGQWALLASTDFSLAQWIGTTILLSTGTNKGGGYLPGSFVTLMIYLAILIIHALMNSVSVTMVAWMEFISVVWHIVGTAVLVIVLPSVATTRQTASFVFTEFTSNEEKNLDSSAYLFLLGLLFAQYSFAGFDASAYMVEETKGQENAGSWGMVLAIIGSGIVGIVYILGLTFCIQDPANITNVNNEAAGYGAAQIMWEVFYQRFGSGTGGIIMMQIVSLGIFFCGLSVLGSCSRMLFAFSRDGATPFSSVWRKNNQNSVPVNAVWVSAFMAFLFGLPSLGSTVAFTAMTSLATIGLFSSYGVPILFRLTIARRHYRKGTFNLNVFSFPLALLAFSWIVTILVLFCLPTSYPIKIGTFQYSSVAVSGVSLLTLLSWMFSARHWFHGPTRTVDPNDSVFNLANLTGNTILYPDARHQLHAPPEARANRASADTDLDSKA